MTQCFSPFINNANPGQERPRLTPCCRKTCRFFPTLPNRSMTRTWPLLHQNIPRGKAIYNNMSATLELSLPYNSQTTNPVSWQRVEKVRRQSMRDRSCSKSNRSTGQTPSTLRPARTHQLEMAHFALLKQILRMTTIGEHTHPDKKTI